MSDLRPIPAALRFPLALYRLIFPIVALMLAPGFLFRMRRRGGHQNGFLQRFGFFSEELRRQAVGKRWTWIHSISVGETLVAIKLAEALRAQDPEIHVALSVTTSTGFALARGLSSDWVMPLYNPIDLVGCVRRTFHFLKPERLVLIEGELWPNLLSESFRRRVPCFLANARLSPRSARRFIRFKSWVTPLLNLLEWIGIQDESELAPWECMNLAPDKLRLTGSIKYDYAIQTQKPDPQFFGSLLESIGVSSECPLLIAGSTHPGEELLIASQLREWRQNIPNLRLILVPRHVERTPSILNELAPLHLKIVKRSQINAGNLEAGRSASPDILLVDTTGELRGWYPMGTVIFVGKSLCGGGGQNPIEAVLAGKPVVFGPRMENFQTVVEQLLAVGGAIEVRDATSLKSVVEDLIKHPSKCASMSQNAMIAMEKHQGASTRTARFILDHSASIPQT